MVGGAATRSVTVVVPEPMCAVIDTVPVSVSIAVSV